MLVGIEVGLMTAGIRHHLRSDRTRYSARDLRLDLEDVLQLPVEGLAPDLHTARVDQLRGHAELITRLAYAPLQHVVHTQECADPLDPIVTPLERERGGAPDHIEPGRSCEPIEDLLGDAVAEILIVGVIADVSEGQYGDRVRKPCAAFTRRIDRIGGCTDLWGLADVLRSPVDEHDGNRREGCKNQVVAAPQRTRFDRLARAEGRSAPDATRADLEQPAKDDRHRQPQHGGPDQRANGRFGDPEPRKHQRRDLQSCPGTKDVQCRGAEDLAPACLAVEPNYSLHGALRVF